MRQNTEQWNTGHSDQILFKGQTPSHTDPLSQDIMIIHQIVFKIYGKITEPWNFGHSDFEVKHEVILTHYPKVLCLCIN